MTTNPETRRHNRYRIDLTGAPADLDRVMAVLNTHVDLLSAAMRVLASNEARNFEAEAVALEDLRAAVEKARPR